MIFIFLKGALILTTALSGTLLAESYFVGSDNNGDAFSGGSFWFFAMVPYLLIGVISLGIGLTLIPVMISALLMVWKVIVVSEDAPTFQAIKKSIRFGMTNLIPASVRILILI